ncbi:hypothetical protein [Flavobacterium sp. 245]|uniref:hypothetical protein n=1 Tax=Flavobacterium sp. 245 TaxID=2512115 RepID=UPI00105FDA29|nr:hypothetical protein [Flavobacterium sp. 245]TDO98521.1 hypothetical protein EV145_108158 [Flavobacterium sp. 245]
MKKKLEADLISIAHRILKLKNKSDINQLYLETQKLYEKLAILKFVDENFDEAKPTISHSEINSQIETIFEKEEEAPAEVKVEPSVAVAETPIEETPEPAIVEEIIAEIPEETTPEPIEEEVQESIEEPIIEKLEETEAVKETEPAEIVKDPIIQKIEEAVSEAKKTIEANRDLSFKTISDLNPIPDFKPAFELEQPAEKEEPKIENSSKSTPIPIAFEDFGINYADAQFVKVDSFEAVSPTPTPTFEFEKKVETAVLETPAEPKAVTLNEKLAKGFHVDLNDRIAFTKNLFGNSTEDYSRVLNQLLTFDTYGEAQEFIENMVKPDYNNWEGKDDYAERFLGIIEKKFS